MHPSATPVFVDDTGRRRARLRRAGRIVLLVFVGYLGLLGAGFARNPHLGPLGLPMFGMPSLVHAPDPPASVLGEATTRAASDGATTGGESVAAADSKGRAGETTRRTVPAGDRPGQTGAGSTPTTVPAGGSASPKAAPATPPASPPATTSTTSGSMTTTTGHGKGTTTTTTDPTSTTTTTTAPSPSGQGTSATSGKGPDGSGPPGQARRPTTTTSPTTLR